jgi:hypothetical protein
MPAGWVARMNVDHAPVGDPLRCFLSDAIVAVPGVRTVEQCIADLVTSGETVIGDSNKRPIMKSGQLVGYISITRRESPEQGW